MKGANYKERACIAVHDYSHSYLFNSQSSNLNLLNYCFNLFLKPLSCRFYFWQSFHIFFFFTPLIILSTLSLLEKSGFQKYLEHLLGKMSILRGIEKKIHETTWHNYSFAWDESENAILFLFSIYQYGHWTVTVVWVRCFLAIACSAGDLQWSDYEEIVYEKEKHPVLLCKNKQTHIMTDKQRISCWFISMASLARLSSHGWALPLS